MKKRKRFSTFIIQIARDWGGLRKFATKKWVFIAYAKRNVVVVTVIGIPRAVGGVNIAFLRRRGTNLRTRPKVACQTEL